MNRFILSGKYRAMALVVLMGWSLLLGVYLFRPLPSPEKKVSRPTWRKSAAMGTTNQREYPVEITQYLRAIGISGGEDLCSVSLGEFRFENGATTSAYFLEVPASLGGHPHRAVLRKGDGLLLKRLYARSERPLSVAPKNR